MFSIAILIGIYSYVVFAMGLLGLLYKPYIILLTIFYIGIVIYFNKQLINRKIIQYFEVLKKYSTNSVLFVFLSIIGLQTAVNLIGSLGPELGFDALWYHLTIPKLYLENHSVFYIPGGLLYYSLMPKLTEMLYVGALALNGEILAKLTHFAFGLLSSIVLYKLSRNFFTPKISLIAVVVFYSNLVVAWQSTTAYVDLARTFFEIMALWGFIKFVVNKDTPYRRSILARHVWLIISAIMLGLAISTKLLALGSLFILSILLIRILLMQGVSLKEILKKTFVYWGVSLLISLPWFVFSFVHTGNPIYPFFTDTYKIGFNIELLNPIRFVREVWGMFIELSDPISPMYIIFLPLVILFFLRHLRDSGQARMTILKVIAIYSLLSIVVWYVTPRTGGGRFILPYLPFFSVLVAAIIENTKDKSIRMVLICVIIIVSFTSILYRVAANVKYIPVVLGTETKNDFLSKNLNFSFYDFYDADGYFKKNIDPKDTILLYGFHNLYYVEFPFIDSSWVKKGDSFNYIATQNTSLPTRFKDWELVYQNAKTHVKLFSKGGIKWAY